MSDQYLDLPFSHLDDNAFELAIYEMNHGLISFNADRLECLHFNPLLTDNTVVCTADLDPDQQFFHQIDSKYYLSDQFNDKITVFHSKSSFSLIHQNIRSLNQNLTSFTDFLSTIDLDFDVIGITETWLQNSIEYTPFIEGYNFIHKCRSSKAGGGVGIYIKSDVVFKQKPDLDFYESDILESIFVEILRPNQSNIVIGTIYRQPNTNVDLSITKLNELLAKLGQEQKLRYLMGDFNIDF